MQATLIPYRSRNCHRFQLAVISPNPEPTRTNGQVQAEAAAVEDQFGGRTVTLLAASTRLASATVCSPK